MRFYLSARYGRRRELCGYAERLRGKGYGVTSTWLKGLHEMPDDPSDPSANQRFAEDDLADLEAADALVFFGEAPGEVSGRARGGRHFECGYAHALAKPVYVVGHRENVFCHLPGMAFYEDFNAFLDDMG